MKNILQPVSQPSAKHKHTFLITAETQVRLLSVKKMATQNGFVFDVDSLLNQALTKGLAAAEKQLSKAVATADTNTAVSVDSVIAPVRDSEVRNGY